MLMWYLFEQLENKDKIKIEINQTFAARRAFNLDSVYSISPSIMTNLEIGLFSSHFRKATSVVGEAAVGRVAGWQSGVTALHPLNLSLI